MGSIGKAFLNVPAGRPLRRTGILSKKRKTERAQDELPEGDRRDAAAVQITTAYVLQHQHMLRNMIQTMGSLIGALDDAFTGQSEPESNRLINELKNHHRNTAQIFQSMMDIGSRVLDPADERLSLKNLIASVLAKSRLRSQPDEVKVGVLEIPDNLSVRGDPALLEIAFTNLLDNSIKSMMNSNQGALSINSTTDIHRQTVTIAIKDTGVGMTQEECDQILRGFFSREGRIAAGIPISKMILAIYDGTLGYESVKGVGTNTLITLPLSDEA